MEKSGAIYWFQCGDLACDEEYIGETSRTFRERFKEHLKEPSPIHNHSCNTVHTTTQDNFQIIGREDHGIARTIKESIYIRVNNPTLNRNIDKFNLHHIWDRILPNTPGLQIRRRVQNIGHAQSTQPNTPCIFSQVLWSMLREHPYLSMHIEPPRTYIRHWISVLPQTWWSPAVGWMKASLISTNVLFQRIFQLLNEQIALNMEKVNI